jgi:integrase
MHVWQQAGFNAAREAIRAANQLNHELLWLYEIVATAAFTGMRRYEILALRLDRDIDLDRATISVTRNVEEIHIAMDGGGSKQTIRRIGTPKSKNSVREFQIDANLVALLRKVRETALQIVAGAPAGADVAREAAERLLGLRGGWHPDDVAQPHGRDERLQETGRPGAPARLEGQPLDGAARSGCAGARRRQAHRR